MRFILGAHCLRCTNRSRSCALLSDGGAAGARDDGGSTAAGSAVVLLSGSLVAGLDLGGKSALDQPRARSANAAVMSTMGVSASGCASPAVSKISVLVPLGMSELGASPLARDVATSVANLTSGCSPEP